MMVFSELNLDAYDAAAIKIAYCKMFKYIMSDFATREDLKFALMPGNIQVQVAVPAGTGSVTAVVYNGSVASPGSAALMARREGDLAAGGAAIDAALGALSKVTGG